MSEPPSARTARALVAALVGQGVRHAVLCPGSRSAPLAYALVAAEEAGWLQLHVRPDERAGGFLALGLTRGGDDAPVAIVTTSGTAVANLHPAVLEAAHAGRPLVVVTADRPHELRGTGANQTTDQVGIFGRATRWSADLPAGDHGARDPAVGERAVEGLVARAVAAACGRRDGHPGPVHLNVGFREPLTPTAPWRPGPVPEPRPRVLSRLLESPSPVSSSLSLPFGPRTVVVAGDGAGVAARHLAEVGGWPLLAEPTSGARDGACAVGPYRYLLDDEALGRAVERVVVLGRPTLSRPVSRLLARTDVEIVVVDPTGGSWTDVAGAAAVVCPAAVPAVAANGAADDWLARWRRAATAAEEVIDAHVVTGPLDGLGVARAVVAATAAGRGGARALVVGASMAVRDVDLVAVPGPAPNVLANRGLAGIDGTVSTAAGVALASGAPVRALLGDLTFLHDVGGLVCGPLEREPDVQVVVVDDGGGAIFATLEHGAPEWSGVYERVFGTPHGTDLAGMAAAAGARVDRVADLAGLHTALDRPVRGRSVVVVRVGRDDLRRRRAALRDAVRDAVRAVAGGAH